MSQRRGAGRGLGILGLFLVIVGIAGGLALYVVSQSRYDDAVDDLVRAPVGCDTTLEFTDTGTFFVFVETRGRLDEIRGDCAAPSTYSRSSDGAPDVTVEMFDDDGEPIEIRDVGRITYDTDVFEGESHGQVEIAERGTVVVRVTSPEFADDPGGADFVIAVGRNPDDVANPVLYGAVAVGIGGIAVGAVLLAFSGMRTRRRTREPQFPGPTSPWAPGQYAPPTAPPIGPPSVPARGPVTPPIWDAPGSPTVPGQPSTPPLRLPAPPAPAAAPAPPGRRDDDAAPPG
ncbi:MAG TPA: hypothetical protein VGK49_04650 [Ilumatobacteraceae bacterium]